MKMEKYHDDQPQNQSQAKGKKYVQNNRDTKKRKKIPKFDHRGGGGGAKVNPSYLAKQRLIEEGLAQQRLKAARIEDKLSDELSNIDSSIASRELRCTSPRRSYVNQLFQRIQLNFCYPDQSDRSNSEIIPNSSSHKFFNRANLIQQVHVNETSCSHYNTVWKRHYHHLLSVYPILQNRFRWKRSLPSQFSRMCFSYHASFGYLIAYGSMFTRKIEVLSLHGRVLRSQITPTVYNEVYWNQYNQISGLFVALSDRHIVFYELAPSHLNEIGMSGFQDSVTNFLWLNECMALSIVGKDICLFTVSSGNVSMNKLPFPLKKLVITTMTKFTEPDSTSQSYLQSKILLGARNGDMLFYDFHTNQITHLHSLPFRILQLHQLRSNPYHCIVKDITGAIAVFDFHRGFSQEWIANPFLTIREGYKTKIDMTGFWVSTNEELLITSAIQKLQQSMNNLSIYSLRHEYCCLHEIAFNHPCAQVNLPASAITIPKLLLPMDSLFGPFACITKTEEITELIVMD